MTDEKYQDSETLKRLKQMKNKEVTGIKPSGTFVRKIENAIDELASNPSREKIMAVEIFFGLHVTTIKPKEDRIYEKLERNGVTMYLALERRPGEKRE